MEVALAQVSDIPPGEGRTFSVGAERIAVFHTRAGELYATQAECPHARGPLADGLLGGSTLVCPLHARKFDLKTGRSLEGECDVKTYQIRCSEAGAVIITV
jgi:nitrite reductase (NADH) small subunit